MTLMKAVHWAVYLTLQHTDTHCSAGLLHSYHRLNTMCACRYAVLVGTPGKSPDEVGQVLRIEARQLESGLLLEGVQQV